MCEHECAQTDLPSAQDACRLRHSTRPLGARPSELRRELLPGTRASSGRSSFKCSPSVLSACPLGPAKPPFLCRSRAQRPDESPPPPSGRDQSACLPVPTWADLPARRQQRGYLLAGHTTFRDVSPVQQAHLGCPLTTHLQEFSRLRWKEGGREGGAGVWTTLREAPCPTK